MTARYDPEAAAAYARTHARRIVSGCTHLLGCRCDPPHTVRCEWVNETGDRCRKGDGHFGEHEFEERK